jgi:hypothetical protein
MDKVLEQLLQSAEIITGLGVLWKFVLARPMEKSEEREAALQKRVNELTDVIKDEAEKKRQRLSLPPARAELPTLDAIKVLGYDPEEEERRRQRELNPGVTRALPFDTQQDYKDHRERNAQHVNPRRGTKPAT